MTTPTNWTPPPATPPTTTRRGVVLPIIVGAVAIIAILTGGLLVVGKFASIGPATGLFTSPLAEAQQKCDPDGVTSRLEDDGATLIMEGVARQGAPGTSSQATACILEALDASSAVVAHVSQTRPLDGRQADAWGDFKASWTFHPEMGLNMVIERT